jgi:hypothetical protein
VKDISGEDWSLAGTRHRHAGLADLVKTQSEAGPALCFHLPRESGADFTLGLGAELGRDQVRSPRARAMADVIARDDEIATLVCDAAHHGMHMRVVGAPMGDADPIQPGAEIALHLERQVACKSPEVGHLAGILRGDDEPEMMRVVEAASREGYGVVADLGSAERAVLLAVPGDAVALEVATSADMGDDAMFGGEQPAAARRPSRWFRSPRGCPLYALMPTPCPGVFMSCVDVTGEFGIIIRRHSLVERDVSLHSILEVLEVKEPFDMNDELLSFGPSFGQEALDVLTDRLIALGLIYVDDFFEFVGIFPTWCRFHASLVPPVPS